MITKSTSLEDLFNQAVGTLSDLEPGEIFIVKQLFRGFEWERIEKGNRTKLGSMFFSYANNAGAEIIVPLNKTAQNQQRYEKK
ncbi:MAG: DUF1413 domain-containing protein [Clostridium sp.]